MRVTDEQIKLLHCHHQRGTQHLDQDGGWQSPSVVHQAARVCAGEVFAAGAYPRVAAKVSRVFRCIYGAGNGNLGIHGNSVSSQDAARKHLRGIIGLDFRQYFPLGADEPPASR